MDKNKKKAHCAWRNMKYRCLTKTSAKYHRYGGRGIMICPEWIDSFDAFYNHVGDPPSLLHSLDRIDNNGNYEPGNVRWATSRQQNENKCTSIPIAHAGVAYPTMAAAARAHGMNKDTLHRRLSRGWSLSDALTKKRQRRPNL